MLKRLIFSAVFLLNSFLAFCQTDNFGIEFWTGFMSNLSTGSEIKLFIAARDNSKVTVSVPLMSYSASFSILKDSVIVVKIPNSVGQINSSEVIEKTGVHIVSDYPIAVTAMNLSPATTDATVVFPLKNVPVNGTYITGHPSRVSNFSGNEFLLVSPDNGVQVEIIPTVKTKGGQQAFKPFYITLNQGETYQVWAETKTDILDGTSVRAVNGKRIIVYTGDKCSAFPCGACDHQYEQVFPNQLLDTAYFVLPHFGHKKGYTVKVVSIDTTINVKVNGKNYRIATKDSALVLDVPSGDSVLHISGPRKFSCFQFMKGPTCNGYVTSGWGDPSILQILSSKYMGQKSTFNAVNSTNLKDHFVSVLINTASKNDVYLDGSKINPSEFIPISYNKTFSYATFKISFGVHTITCNLGHLAYCYGIGNYESYLYTAGFSLPNFEIDIKDSVLSFNCKDNKVMMRFDGKLEGSIKSYQWDFGDGTFDTLKTVKHLYPVGKEFKIKLWAKGYNGREDSVIKKYIFNWPVFNPVFDKLLCDPTYTYVEKNPFFKNFVWHDNTTKNSYTVTKTEKIWVSATDTSGYCKFSDTAEISKVDILSKIIVDTISNCHLNNLFKFRDSSYVKNDQIQYKVWTFPGGKTFYDTTNFYYHFRQPGNFVVYLDIYPVNAECKARYEIPVHINWNTDIDAYTDKQQFCNGELVTIKDSSYSCCQKVKKYYWKFEGEPLLSSNTGKLQTRVYFDTKNGTPVRNYLYITETEQGCFDTLKYGVLAMPAANSNFDFGKDTIKCLALSRWTFTHTVNEAITGPYELHWYFGNGKEGTQNQYKNFRYIDTGTYKIKLISKTQLGCLDSTSKSVKVIGNAGAAFQIPDSIQCFKNNLFKFDVTTKGNNLLYKWNFGNGKTSTSSTPAPIQYNSYGLFKVKMKVAANYPGCFDDSITHTIKVLREPKASFSLPNDSFCFFSNSITPVNSSTFYNGKNKFLWSSTNYLDSVEFPKSIEFTDTGIRKIMLVVIDSMLCSDTISQNINILPQPKAAFSINDSVQCFTNNLFQMEYLSGHPKNKLLWKLDNNGIGTNQQVSINNVPDVGLHKISLYVTSPFGCTDSVIKYFEVLPPIRADFTIDKDTQCFDNHNVTIKDNSTVSKDVIVKYEYSYNQNILANTSDLINYQFPQSGPKTVHLKIETKEGCLDTTSKSLYLADNPEVEFLTDSVCLGETIDLSAQQTKGIFPIDDWQWKMGDGITYTTNPISHIYMGSGNFITTLKFTDKLGCSGSLVRNSLIYPLPDASFQIQILNSDQDFSYIRLLPTNYGYLSYLWNFPDGSSSVKDSLTKAVSRFFKDRVYLKVETSYGCKDTLSKFLYVFPRLENLWIENAFTPNNDQLNDVFKPIHFEGATAYKLSVFNRWGELMFTSNNPNLGWDGTFMGKEAQDGVYIYNLEFIYADGNRYSAKGTVALIR